MREDRQKFVLAFVILHQLRVGCSQRFLCTPAFGDVGPSLGQGLAVDSEQGDGENPAAEVILVRDRPPGRHDLRIQVEFLSHGLLPEHRADTPADNVLALEAECLQVTIVCIEEKQVCHLSVVIQDGFADGDQLLQVLEECPVACLAVAQCLLGFAASPLVRYGREGV